MQGTKLHQRHILQLHLFCIAAQNVHKLHQTKSLWWSLCTLYLPACHMRVTIGDSSLCCYVCVMSFKRFGARLTSLVNRGTSANNLSWLELFEWWSSHHPLQQRLCQVPRLDKHHGAGFWLLLEGLHNVQTPWSFHLSSFERGVRKRLPLKEAYGSKRRLSMMMSHPLILRIKWKRHSNG